VTFADSVLRLVRIGARIDPVDIEGLGPSPDPPGQASATATESRSGNSPALPPAETATAGQVPPAAGEDLRSAGTDDHSEAQPGLDDLEAAVSLVAAGLASRVVMVGFPSWPGLLWRAYQLADAADVLILPTVVRPGGKVDIVITRDSAADG
jgi:hypothetical protein